MLTVGDLAQNIDDGDQMVMLILDFSKNIDEDPHERLMVKLKHLIWYQGENIRMDQVVADKKNTIYCGSISKPVAVTSGVPQDTVHARSS